VTSRDALSGLVARDGAQRLDLDLLPQQDAVGLLRALIGERVDADPGAAAALAGRCARLPLALRVAAELAAARPHTSLTALVSELADQQGRLDLLAAGGDPRTAVRAVFSWSYRHLAADAARAFRLAGLHPGTDFDPHAVAALTATTPGRALQLLEVLARAHLVQPAGAGRYGMHDLLRAYAAGQAHATDSDQERHAALTGLFDYYLAATAAAMDALFPGEKDRRPRPPGPIRPVPPPPSPDTARDWLDAERANLVAMTAHGATGGWPSHAITLAAILYRYFEAVSHHTDAQVVYASALDSARQTGDLAAQAESLKNLGLVDIWQGHCQQAAERLGAALELYRRTVDRRGQSQTLGNLGIVAWRLGHLQQAADQFSQVLALFRDIGDRFGEGQALTKLGLVEQRQGHYEQAAGHQWESAAIFRELGDRRAEANVLHDLGDVLCRQGRYQEAEDHLDQALAIYREFGDRSSEAYVLNNLGHVLRGRGRYQQAVGLYRQALTTFREFGQPSGEAEALNSLGEALSGAGLPGQARVHHDDALTVARQIGDRYEQARAHDGLARAYHATSDPGQARHHWQQALTLYTEVGAPEADQVRAQLGAAEER